MRRLLVPSLLALFGQAGTWAWFLNEEQDAIYAEGFRNYVGASLSDKGGVEAVRRAFKGTASVEELNASYRAYLEQSGDAWRAANEPARGELEASFRLSGSTESNLKRQVEDYCDQKLAGFEAVLDRTMLQVRDGRARLTRTALDDEREAEVEAEALPDVDSSGFFDQDA